MTRRGWLTLLGGGVLGAVVRPAALGAAPTCDPRKGRTYFRYCVSVLFPNQNDSPEVIRRKLIDGNTRYVNGEAISHSLAFDITQEIATGQAPAAMILSCADSRVVPELVFDQPRASLFVCRVAGNLSTAEIVGSFEYGVAVLGAKLLVVLGHSNCGAVNAAIAFVRNGTRFPGHIQTLVEAIAPAVRNVIDHVPTDDPGALLLAATNENARLHALALAHASPILKPAFDAGELGVAFGFVDLEPGLTSVGPLL
jgi:carbonic anhydrase